MWVATAGPSMLHLLVLSVPSLLSWPQSLDTSPDLCLTLTSSLWPDTRAIRRTGDLVKVLEMERQREPRLNMPLK